MPPSHYQLSFTARQAMVFFAVCLVALGLSFFFGLMTGLSGRGAEDAGLAPAVDAAKAAPADSSAADKPGADAAAAAGTLPLDSPTPPAVLETFEDRVSEPTAPPPPASTRRPAVAQAPPAAAPGLWIQVASLASRREADALASRLSGHAYRAQVAVADGPKGRVFRVRVGPYRSEGEAARAAEKLRREERIHETWVVRDGN